MLRALSWWDRIRSTTNAAMRGPHELEQQPSCTISRTGFILFFSLHNAQATLIFCFFVVYRASSIKSHAQKKRITTRDKKKEETVNRKGSIRHQQDLHSKRSKNQPTINGAQCAATPQRSKFQKRHRAAGDRGALTSNTIASDL
jgi:hypothetical protein